MEQERLISASLLPNLLLLCNPGAQSSVGATPPRETPMKKSSLKRPAVKSNDFVHSKFGSLEKLIKTFKNRAAAGRFGSRIPQECQPDAETREFLLRLLDAAAKDDLSKSRFACQELNLSILRFVLKDDFTAGEIPCLLQLILLYSSVRHLSDSYDSEIDELFSLPDRRLITFLDTMLNHEMLAVREAAIELLEVSWNRGRIQPWIVSRVAEYVRDNPNRSSLEDAYLEILTPKFKAKRVGIKKTTKS